MISGNERAVLALSRHLRCVGVVGLIRLSIHILAPKMHCRTLQFLAQLIKKATCSNVWSYSA
jgi:hypothetical protein